MIAPLPYSADFRPYFTIHDGDFGALAAGQLPDGGNALPRLLGVTNLYFLKAGLAESSKWAIMNWSSARRRQRAAAAAGRHQPVLPEGESATQSPGWVMGN